MEKQTGGWVKIHRKITEWEWYQDKNTLLVFLHLLLVVNHSPKKWMGTIIEKGETTRSLPTLAQELKMSIQEIRTTIKKLKSTGEVTERQHGKFRLLKLKKYEKYQGENGKSTGRATANQQGNQQSINSQSTANKNEKNDKNKYIPEIGISESKEIAEVIYAFKNLNPMYSEWFSRPPVRKKCELLVKKFTLQKVLNAISFLESISDDRFAPSITTPAELETKWGKLKLYYLKRKEELNKNEITEV